MPSFSGEALNWEAMRSCFPLENHQAAPLGRKNFYAAYKISGLSKDGRVHTLCGLGKLEQTPSHRHQKTDFSSPSQPGSCAYER